MRTIELKMLSAVSERMRIKDIATAINSSYRTTARAVNDLLQQGYLAKIEGEVGWAPTALATVFKKVSRRYDVAKLLGGSREEVLLALLESHTVRDIQSVTRLSYRSIRRALDTLMETGAVKEKNKRYTVVEDQELQLFLTTLMEEQRSRLVEPYAEVVFASHGVILKRVPMGKSAEGTPTAFSVFGRYGVELVPVSEYFVQPERELGVEEVLVHAVVFSKNPVELTDCAVLYAKNRNGMDLGRVRRTAKDLGVLDLILDLENYVRNLTVVLQERFLPWSEFAEKARLYGVSPESLMPPSAFPAFFDELGRHVRQEVSLYLFGGEAMRIRGLKRATKDVDVVVQKEKEFNVLRESLMALGYRTLVEKDVSKTDVKLKPSAIFVREGRPRVDLFSGVICNVFHLSDTMMSRCEKREMGNLKLCIMSNEDVFLLKSVTDREGDIYDMIELAKSMGFDWRVVFEELLVQEEKTGRHFCLALLDSVEIIEKRTNIRSPFYNSLTDHCIDLGITESVQKWNATTLKQIRELVNYPDYKLRSRIKRLIADGKLLETREGKFAVSEPRRS